MPQLMTEYVNTGKVRYVFVDYPIAQLHPDAFQCARSGGMRRRSGQVLADARQPVHELAGARCRAAHRAGENAGAGRKKFAACLERRSAHAAAIRDSIARMQQLGVGGTPLTLIGLTPAAGCPMKVVSSVYGAQPYRGFQEPRSTRALAQAR